MEALLSTFGLFVLLALAWLVSEDRRNSGHARTAIVGAGIQIIVALALLKVPLMQSVFVVMNGDRRLLASA
jgi:nucleoside permease NupC